jgi:hypothetical protein
LRETAAGTAAAAARATGAVIGRVIGVAAGRFTSSLAGAGLAGWTATVCATAGFGLLLERKRSENFLAKIDINVKVDRAKGVGSFLFLM